MAEKEAAYCPNCNYPAIRQGKVIFCEKCDASFRFTPEGPKLHEIGPLEARLRNLEEKVGLGEAVAPPEKSPATEALEGQANLELGDDEEEEEYEEEDF